MSRVMLNDEVTSNIIVTRLVCQGCPLIPLLFAIVSHPLLVILSRLATNGSIVGLHPPFWTTSSIGFGMRFFHVSRVSHRNLEKGMLV